MSAVIGGRSGNRGACAQPCRLRYGWHGKADANPLSLKDANLAAYAGEMAEMGVACLKLEGRMKRPEYVAAVTGIYAALLREHRAPTANEPEKARAGILTRRVHGRLLPRPAREGNVWRSPGNCALAGGVVRHAAGGL